MKLSLIKYRIILKTVSLWTYDAEVITNQEKINNMTEGERKSRDMVAGILKFIGGAMASLMSLAKAMIPAFVGLGIAIAVAFYPVTLTPS